VGAVHVLLSSWRVNGTPCVMQNGADAREEARCQACRSFNK
jgi:hypothetical protein